MMPALVGAAAPLPVPPPKNVQEITEEVMRSNNDPIGRPLPVAAHWQSGIWPYQQGVDSEGLTFVDLVFQRELIRDGKHWLPSVSTPVFAPAYDKDAYWNGGWPDFARWRIPVSMVTTQPEDWLTDPNRPTPENSWRNLPIPDNPRWIVAATGELHGNQLDPLAPLQTSTQGNPWYEVGEYWARSHQVDEWIELKNAYPDMPKILIISNNEASRLRSFESNSSQRYLAKYEDLGNEESGHVVYREHCAKEWQPRYEEMFKGMRDGFLTPQPAWRYAAWMVGYTTEDIGIFAFLSNWVNGPQADYFPDNVVFRYRYWDGGSPEAYLAPYTGQWDYLPYNPAMHHMNLKWQLDIIYAGDPEYWYEFSLWDGAYRDIADDKRYTLTDWTLVSGEYQCPKPSEISEVGAVYFDDIHLTLGPQGSLAAGEWAYNAGIVYVKDDPSTATVQCKKNGRDKRDIAIKDGYPYTPERYKALVRFCMWLNKPRAVREFRGTTEGQERIEPEYLERMIEAVDEVWDEPLRSFWRHGQSVKNTAYEHPYQINVPPEYASVERWWLLDTNLDPARPWDNLTTELPVLSLALVLGDAPSRQWLIYAFSPKQDRTGVQITVPGYPTNPVTIDVPQAGVFHVVNET